MKCSLIRLAALVACGTSSFAAAFESSRQLATRPALRLRAGANDEPIPDVSDLESLIVFSSKAKNKVRDGRDSLPYFLDVISPPPRRLGVYALDAATRSGDLLECESSYYEVQRVRSLYRYRSGAGFVMVKKYADLKEASRAMEERWLGRVMKIESEQGGALAAA
jgi:hypothetical protein